MSFREDIADALYFLRFALTMAVPLVVVGAVFYMSMSWIASL